MTTFGVLIKDTVFLTDSISTPRQSVLLFTVTANILHVKGTRDVTFGARTERVQERRAVCEVSRPIHTVLLVAKYGGAVRHAPPLAASAQDPPGDLMLSDIGVCSASSAPFAYLVRSWSKRTFRLLLPGTWKELAVHYSGALAALFLLPRRRCSGSGSGERECRAGCVA